MSKTTNKLDIDKKVDELVKNSMREFSKIRRNVANTPDEFYCFTMNFIEHLSANIIADTLSYLEYPRDRINEMCENIVEQLADPLTNKLKEIFNLLSKEKVH